MAEATFNPAVYPDPTPIKDAEIVLKLTPEEAATLRIVFGSIGGDPAYSLRKHTNSVDASLSEVGVDINYSETSLYSRDRLYFKEVSSVDLKYFNQMVKKIRESR